MYQLFTEFSYVITVLLKKLIISGLPFYIFGNFLNLSSAATIPVNMESAQKNGVSKEIREFVIPVSAMIYLVGSVIATLGAANVSGENAIALSIDKVYKNNILKDTVMPDEE